MDGDVPQAQFPAIRCECRIPGVGIPFRIHKNAIPAVFTLNQHAVPAEVTRIKPHLVAVVKQENLIVLEAGFLKLPELLIGENDYLFHLKMGLPFRHRPQWVLSIEVVDMAGPVVKDSVLLIGFRFL